MYIYIYIYIRGRLQPKIASHTHPAVVVRVQRARYYYLSSRKVGP